MTSHCSLKTHKAVPLWKRSRKRYDKESRQIHEIKSLRCGEVPTMDTVKHQNISPWMRAISSEFIAVTLLELSGIGAIWWQFENLKVDSLWWSNTELCSAKFTLVSRLAQVSSGINWNSFSHCAYRRAESFSAEAISLRASWYAWCNHGTYNKA